MKTAFKEWAVVCEALASGRQILILRKGGIAEDEGVFQPLHSEFLLLPTYVHQAQTGVREEFQPLLRQAEKARPETGSIRISYWARVAATQEVRSLEALDRLRDEHIWSDAIVHERFHRWSSQSVHALVLRVFALNQPVSLPDDDRYAGCKSWIELLRDVPTSPESPVVADEEFDARAKRILDLLKESPTNHTK